MSEPRTETALPSFFDLYMRGDAAADDIDDYVGRWHDKFEGRSEYPPLHEYLGLSHDEYEVLMCDPFALPVILLARRPGGSLQDLMADRFNELRAANRREDRSIIFSLGHWLKRRPRH
jgi:hypothetical protein